MNLDQQMEQVAVIGAAGKMGSGISLLLAQELVRLKKQNPDTDYKLHLIDVRAEALSGLLDYLEKQAGKLAERKPDALKGLYPDADPARLAGEYVADLIGVIETHTETQAAAPARLVFEAVIENEALKLKILGQLREVCGEETWFFTNTSSIPVGVLDEGAGLGGKILGFHFYNPPAVQKLLEIISNERTDSALVTAGEAIARRLGKIIYHSADVAGFIGNGHFMRDALGCLDAVARLRNDPFSREQAIYVVNRVSQDWLIRPMGIFQLMDYVGVDVMQFVFAVMDQYIEGESFLSELVNEMVAAGAVGGQNADGSQKDGFFRYEGGRPVAIYALQAGGYEALEDEQFEQVDEQLGVLPRGAKAWKELLKAENRDAQLDEYFTNLHGSETLGARLALEHLRRSKDIGLNLVETGVAASAEDVNGVVMNGFYHLYGPINDYA